MIAHEYGHHVQDLLGDLSAGGVAGRESRLGAHGAAGRLLRRRLGAQRRRDRLHRRPHQADIADGLDAAAAVGDDRIQQETQGQVKPETWTHGSSAQRQRWFLNGFRGKQPSSCDTFSAKTL